MPLLHRLACFRDDIIFFIYLYQRWVYSVDMTRVNEFGQGGDATGEEEEDATPIINNPSSDMRINSETETPVRVTTIPS